MHAEPNAAILNVLFLLEKGGSCFVAWYLRYGSFALLTHLPQWENQGALNKFRLIHHMTGGTGLSI